MLVCDSAIPLDWRVILFVGSLVFQKHPELAIQAVAIARRSVPELVLLVAGEGAAQSDARAARRRRDPSSGEQGRRRGLARGLRRRLEHVPLGGAVARPLEALWRGRPLVVTDAPGNAEAAGRPAS